jgi:hypothetical protein
VISTAVHYDIVDLTPVLDHRNLWVMVVKTVSVLHQDASQPKSMAQLTIELFVLDPVQA